MATTDELRHNLDANDSWIYRDDDLQRVLDVYYTDQGTKLYVKDGSLVEEKIERSSNVKPFDDVPESPGSSDGGAYTCYQDQPTQEDNSEIAREQTISTAIPALEYYNRKQHTNYQLVDPVRSNGAVRDGIWYHCNFTASEPSQEGLPDSAPKLFFAELKVERVKTGTGFSVTTCCFLNDGESTTGCNMCGTDGELLHPSDGGYLQGTPKRP